MVLGIASSNEIWVVLAVILTAVSGAVWAMLRLFPSSRPGRSVERSRPPGRR